MGHTRRAWAVMVLLTTPGVLSAQAPFGQPPAGTTPALLGPGILSTGDHELAVRFAADLQSCDVMRAGPDWHTAILRFRREGETWREVGLAPIPFEGGVAYPALSPDGKVLVFDGTASGGGMPALWRSEWRGEAWQKPVRLPDTVNGPGVVMHASLAANGNLYFSSNRPGGLGGFDLYRTRLTPEGYAPAENLGSGVNSPDFDAHPWIDPQERYLLFDSRRPGGQGGNDLYVSFRKPDGTWAPAQNLGPEVNSGAGEMRPYVPPSGGVLYFCSDRILGHPATPSPSVEAFHRRIHGPGNGSQDLWGVSLEVVARLASTAK